MANEQTPEEWAIGVCEQAGATSSFPPINELAAIKRKADAADRYEAALRRIEKWFNEFPPAYDYAGRSSTYGMEYGSNGERDFMRQIARTALEGK